MALPSTSFEERILDQIESELTNTNPDLFSGVPSKKKKELLESFATIGLLKNNYPILPDSDTLKQYDTIIPNGADRMMKIVERQQAHKVDIANRVARNQYKQQRLKEVLNFAKQVVGISVGSTAVSLITIFLFRKK